MIYLDYAASTPVDSEVLDIFNKTIKDSYANPNASHKLGIQARQLIDKSTKNIANLLGVLPEEIIYTSGASESNNLAIKGICERYKNRGKHILLSCLEHNSIIAPATVMQEHGFEIDLIPVNSNGLIDINELKKMIRDDTILVSICAVDSEIGLKQPIEEIGKLLKDYPNIVFHTDASQAIGKVELDISNVDLVTMAPHKFYGMNGIGILVKKKNIGLVPIIHGGRSTTIYRSGTPITEDIVALNVALTKAIKLQSERTLYVKELNKIILDKFKEYKKIHINGTDNSIPYTINFSIKGVKSQDIVGMLESHDIFLSTKTSCCPLNTPSKLVYALTRDKSLATTSVRISLSHLTTKEEIDTFLSVFDECYKELDSSGKI